MIYYSEKDKELWTTAVECKCNWWEVKAKLQDNKFKLSIRFKEIFIKSFFEVNRLLGIPEYNDIIKSLTLDIIEKIVNYSRFNRSYRSVDLYALLIEVQGILVHKDRKYQFNPDKIFYLCRCFKYDDIIEQIKNNFKDQLKIKDYDQNNQVISYEGYLNKLQDICIPLQYEKPISDKSITQIQFLELYRNIVQTRNVPYWEAKVIEYNLINNIFQK